MGRNFKAEAERIIREFEKSRMDNFLDNKKIVEGWNKQNPKPTNRKAEKFEADLWARMSQYCDKEKRRFGKAFMDYVLFKDSNSVKENSCGQRNLLTKTQMAALRKKKAKDLLDGVIGLLKSGKVKPLSS